MTNDKQIISGLEKMFEKIDGLQIKNMRNRFQIPGATYDLIFDNPHPWACLNGNDWVGVDYAEEREELLIMLNGRFLLPSKIVNYINTEFKDSESSQVNGRIYIWKGISPEEILRFNE